MCIRDRYSVTRCCFCPLELFLATVTPRNCFDAELYSCNGINPGGGFDLNSKSVLIFQFTLLSEGWSIFTRFFQPQAAAEKSMLVYELFKFILKHGESPEEYFARGTRGQAAIPKILQRRIIHGSPRAVLFFPSGGRTSPVILWRIFGIADWPRV